MEELEAAGISTADPQSIGRELEHERLSQMLERLPVKGIGPKRRQVLLSTYGRVWELRGAPAGEIARLPSFNPKLAEELVEALP
ncbi:MAG: helix-hairpin-helix domain-containing protein [Gemmatimonadota bacterium]|nr:helix-hairpin-helix domain-containing protein [Gemmatimonadota bacterium]